MASCGSAGGSGLVDTLAFCFWRVNSAVLVYGRQCDFHEAMALSSSCRVGISQLTGCCHHSVPTVCSHVRSVVALALQLRCRLLGSSRARPLVAACDPAQTVDDADWLPKVDPLVERLDWLVESAIATECIRIDFDVASKSIANEGPSTSLCTLHPTTQVPLLNNRL